LTVNDVRAARGTIAGRLHRTPTFSSRQLSELTGGTVFLKAECFQRTGSFKPRGVLNKLASLSAEEKARGVISISAGNHAQALAYASALEGIDALIVMWASASAQKIAAARGYGPTIDTAAAGAPVVAVEAELSSALHDWLAAGRPVTVKPNSIADGLAGPFAGESCLAVCQERVDDAVLVTEDDIREAFRFLYGRAKIACKAAG